MEIGIIFYVILFAIIASTKKATKNGNKVTKREVVPPSVSAKKEVVETNVFTKRKTAIPQVAKKKNVTPNVPRKKNDVPVFMEPHTEEKEQPQIRNNSLWGEDQHASERIVALRLMEGDPVPEGYVRIVCPYCAADNLVTKHCKQYHSCYFCRVPID